MDKIKQHLEKQHSQLNHETEFRVQREQKISDLCTQVGDWLAPLSSSLKERWQIIGQERTLHLNFLANDTLILRFSPRWHKNPERILITLTIFSASQPRIRTQLELGWCHKRQHWRILTLKCQKRWFNNLFYRRVFSKNTLEYYLLNFLPST